MKIIVCPVCENSNNQGLSNSFNKEGERPSDEKVNCLVCDDIGHIEPQFFLEFTFEELHSENSYWLPLMIYTNDMKVAEIRKKEIVKALSTKFKNIASPRPLPYHRLSQFHLEQAFGHRKGKLVKKLNIAVDPIQETEIPNSVIFSTSLLIPVDADDNLNFKYNIRQFPVWVMKESSEFFDLNDILVVSFSKQ